MRKNKVAVLFFRAGLCACPFSKYKTSTLSKFTEPWQYANIVFNVSDEFAYISSLNIRTCSIRHKKFKCDNIHKFYLLVLDEAVF